MADILPMTPIPVITPMPDGSTFHDKAIAWLKQSTTIQGFALLVFTIIMQVSNESPWPVILGSACASVVLIILPGHGDLSSKFGALVNDIASIAETQAKQGAHVVNLAEGQAAIVKIVPADMKVMPTDLKIVPADSKVILVDPAAPINLHGQ